MTKAAYKAMDAMTEFCQKNKFADLKKFMVAGASKVIAKTYENFNNILCHVFGFFREDGPLGLW